MEDNSEKFLVAYQSQQLEIVKSLFFEGNIEKYYYTHVFNLSCSDGNTEMVQFLLDFDTNDKINIHDMCNYGFRFACENGHISIVKLLLNLTGHKKINITNGKEHCGFVNACSNGKIEIVKLLCQRKEITQPYINFGMVRACHNGHINVVEFLLTLKHEKHVDVHYRNSLMFYQACKNGHHDIVKLFIGLEGDRKIFLKNNNYSAFIALCDSYQKFIVESNRYNHEKTILFLLSLKDDNQIPEHIIREYVHPEIIKSL